MLREPKNHVTGGYITPSQAGLKSPWESFPDGSHGIQLDESNEKEALISDSNHTGYIAIGKVGNELPNENFKK